MKIIFLDFDGVLNNYDYLRKVHMESIFGEPDDKASFEDQNICPENVEHLNSLIEKAGPEDLKIVVSSTWRIGRSVEELQQILERNGFEGEVYDTTTTADLGCRGDQIQEWLDTYDAHEVESFVILDDDADMGSLSNRLVQTSIFNKGLTSEHVEEALEILDTKFMCSYCGEDPCMCTGAWA